MPANVICNFVEQCHEQQVFLVSAEENSLPCWHYVWVDAQKLPIFKGLLHFLPLNLTLPDYGKILLSGSGANPPANIVTQIANGEFIEPAQTSEVFCLLANADDGREFFTYLDVPPFLLNKFKKISAAGESFDYEEWGEIIHSGWGKPTPEIVAMMSEKHGIETPVSD